MTCIQCESPFHRRPVYYYFCSQTCWEDAKTTTPWRILSEGFGPFTSPVKFVTSTRYPRPSWQCQRTRRHDRIEVPVRLLEQYGP